MQKDKDLTSCSSSFDEGQHPRDGDGKFVDKGGGAGGSTAAELQRADEITGEASASIKDLTTLLGTEYTGFKGQQAVDKLMQEKQGHVKGAFHREDIGDIDLIWGSDTVGLQHILIRRAEQGIEAEQFTKNLAKVVESGIFHQKSEKGNFEFWYQGKMVVIAPEYHGNKITYLLTSYKRTKIKAPQ